MHLLRIVAMMSSTGVLLIGCGGADGRSSRDPAKSVVAAEDPNAILWDFEKEITSTIRRKVASDDGLSRAAKSVEVTTKGRKVTLRGTVPSIEEKLAIEAHAMHTSGVAIVDSQINVTK